METYSVLLIEEQPLPAPALAASLAAVLERPLGELTRGLREHPWILAEDVPADALDAVFEVLSREKVRAKAVPGIHMPVLPPPLRVRIADPLEKGIFLQAAQPPAPPLLPWEGLTVVSTGLLSLTEEEARSGTEIQPGASGPDLTTPGSAALVSGRKRMQDHILTDLVWTEKTPMRLRIDAGTFRYDYLGKRMRPSSRENLRLLLSDIRNRAPEAWFAARTERFLDGAPTSTFRFRNLPAFESYTLWNLQAREEARLEEA